MAQGPPGESKKIKIKMSKTKAAIAIVDDDESVCRAISPLRASTCLAEKETFVRELFGRMVNPATQLKRR